MSSWVIIKIAMIDLKKIPFPYVYLNFWWYQDSFRFAVWTVKHELNISYKNASDTFHLNLILQSYNMNFLLIIMVDRIIYTYSHIGTKKSQFPKGRVMLIYTWN